MSVDTRPTIACCWSSVDNVSVDMSTEGRPTCRSSVDRGSIEVSIATIDRHSIAGVISTHDPIVVADSDLQLVVRHAVCNKYGMLLNIHNFIII